VGATNGFVTRSTSVSRCPRTKLLLPRIATPINRRAESTCCGSSTNATCGQSRGAWPDDIRPVRLSLAIKSGHYKEQFQFVRILTESEGWLAAGWGEDNCHSRMSHLDARMKLNWQVGRGLRKPALFCTPRSVFLDREAGVKSMPLLSPIRQVAARSNALITSFHKSTWNEYMVKIPKPTTRAAVLRTRRRARAFSARQLAAMTGNRPRILSGRVGRDDRFILHDRESGLPPCYCRS